MILEPHDIQNLIMDLYIFCTEHPDKKLPMRYLWILSKILNDQLHNHPAVTGDDIQGIIVVNPDTHPGSKFPA